MGRRILVTGAGSGLGRATGLRLARDGHRVLFTDRDGASAAAAADGLPQCAALHLDVTDDVSWSAAEQWCQEHWGGLDVLVNNAGIGAAGRAENIEIEDWRFVIEVNLLSVVRGCRTFIPGMKSQGSGHIVNVASLAGLLALPGMSSYNVTKSGVIAFSDTIRTELAPYGIDTTLVCPGFVRTNLAASVRSSDADLAALTAKLVNGSKLTAEDVADQIAEAIAKRRYLVLTERSGRIAWLTKRFTPSVAVRKTLELATKLRASDLRNREQGARS